MRQEQEEIKLCKRGHPRTPEKTNKSGRCKECIKIHNSSWYKANSEKVREDKSARRKANPEKARAPQAAWNKANPGRLRAITAAWRKANPEKVRSGKVAWRKANLGKSNAITAKSSAVARRNLYPRYIAALLGVKTADLPAGLLILKREQLQLMRFIRKAKAAKEKTNVDIPCNA